MATPNILKIQADVRAAGIPVKGEPTVVVRKISGTSSPSQHSYGNAIDWYPTDPKQAADARRGIKVPALEQLYQYLRGHPLARVVCYYDRGGCTTNHRDHVHVDASPKIRSQSHLQEVLSSGRSSGGGERTHGNNPWVPDIIEDPYDSAQRGVESVGDALSGIGDFIGLITSGEFVKRAALVSGGVIVGVAGVYFIAKEFGAPTVTQVAGAAVGGGAGVAAKAAKGAAAAAG